MDGLIVVHEDEALVVVDKPAGMLAVPGRGDDRADSIARRAVARWADALVVHRLDMATSGLMVLARGAASQRRLARAFERREVRKTYVAVVHGRVATAAGTIDLPLAADWPRRPRQRVDAVHGRPALTRWRTIGHACGPGGAPATRLELEPVTGRTHQLRVHLQAIGHPMVGDALYAEAVEGPSPAATRLLLHACALAFAHPMHGAPMRFGSAVPF
ncbi:MAG: RluA family pseudouridine synthase [Rubrivivax sp.]|nr:RluA family pseudouridine synthase [Rubrivivax sp.]